MSSNKQSELLSILSELRDENSQQWLQPLTPDFPLPPAPPYPCPHLDDFSSFAPLYHRQWRVLPSPTTRSLSLRKAFGFRTMAATAQFVNGIIGPGTSIAEAEGHHPDKIHISSKKVLLSLKTHSAFIQDDFKNRVVKPGLTDRDFRLAILIERLFEEEFREKRGKLVVQNDGRQFQPLSLSDVEWDVSAKGTVFEYLQD